MVPKGVHIQSPEPMPVLPWVTDVITLRNLRWRDHPGGTRVIARIFIRGSRGSERGEDVAFLALKMEEGTTSQGR